jgi:hypothetical protein
MKRYASVFNGAVEVVVEQDEPPVIDGVWIDITDLDVGPFDLYDGTTFTKYVPPPPPKIITKPAFRFRFTDDEYVGILSAAKTDVEVQSWVETFNMLARVDLDNQRTKDGVNKLASKNLLTQARANAILTDPVQDSERP